MRRRDFVAFLGGATAWVSAARAQEPRRVIGILNSMSYGSYPGTEVAFAEGLRDAGFIPDRNIASSGAGLRGNTIACPRLRANSCAVAWL